MPTLSEFEQGDEEVSKHAFRVYHFFEKWSLLVREQQVDAVLLSSILGSYAKWWNDFFFTPIKHREVDVYMASVLAIIEAQVLNKLNVPSDQRNNA